MISCVNYNKFAYTIFDIEDDIKAYRIWSKDEKEVFKIQNQFDALHNIEGP